MAKYLSTAFFRDVVNRQRFGDDEGITFHRMLEMIEEEVIKNYNNDKETNQGREVEQGK
jgi:hypothetical protein